MNWFADNAFWLIPVVGLGLDGLIAYLTKDGNDQNDRWIPILRNAKKLLSKFQGRQK